jgi:hypothetical protein
MCPSTVKLTPGDAKARGASHAAAHADDHKRKRDENNFVPNLHAQPFQPRRDQTFPEFVPAPGPQSQGLQGHGGFDGYYDTPFEAEREASMFPPAMAPPGYLQPPHVHPMCRVPSPALAADPGAFAGAYQYPPAQGYPPAQSFQNAHTYPGASGPSFPSHAPSAFPSSSYGAPSYPSYAPQPAYNHVPRSAPPSHLAAGTQPPGESLSCCSD